MPVCRCYHRNLHASIASMRGPVLTGLCGLPELPGANNGPKPFLWSA